MGAGPRRVVDEPAAAAGAHSREAAADEASTSLPFSASVGLPLDVLRDVQDTFVANPWLLALPELAPFRTFVADARGCQSGEAERALRAVRAETRGALEARSWRESASEGDDAGAGADADHTPTAADVEALRVQAVVLLPRGGGVDVAGGVPAAPAVRPVRSFSQAAVATSGRRCTCCARWWGPSCGRRTSTPSSSTCMC